MLSIAHNTTPRQDPTATEADLKRLTARIAATLARWKVWLVDRCGFSANVNDAMSTILATIVHAIHVSYAWKLLQMVKAVCKQLGRPLAFLKVPPQFQVLIDC